MDCSMWQCLPIELKRLVISHAFHPRTWLGNQCFHTAAVLSLVCREFHDELVPSTLLCFRLNATNAGAHLLRFAAQKQKLQQRMCRLLDRHSAST